MNAFDTLIEKIKGESWLVRPDGTIRTLEGRCPLDSLCHVQNDFYGGNSTTYAHIGGTERQAWVIMSAADNLTGSKGLGRPFDSPTGKHHLPIKEVKAMRTRLLKALNLKENQ